jgi:farnesyl-diphosphate farnesyltransferase
MSILKSVFRPDELSALYKLRFGNRKARKKAVAHQAEPNEDLAFCFATLNNVSRSFALVIRQLPSELSTNVCLFYLVLRALDSIEDDMNIPHDTKGELLRSFHEKNYLKGWKIKDVGDKKEYRDLLASYYKVVNVFLTLDKKFQDIITDVCREMGSGMADFSEKKILSTEDYDLYCHYVAGLVGIGLSRIFVASGLEEKEIEKDEALANSMGLFLQKTNIVRDYHEDLFETRTFWPQEIWGQYVKNFSDLGQNARSKNSVACLNHMVNDALAHATDCLAYLGKLKNRQIFRFCAIPQVMAMATLCEVYDNPKVFRKNVKIRKGYAAKLILNTNTIADVVNFYFEIALAIENKVPYDIGNSGETLKLTKNIRSYCQRYSGKAAALLENA